MRALVTGGAGFIGSHLCDALVQRGDDVLVVDNLVGTHGSARNIAHLLNEPNFGIVQADIAEWATPERLRGFDTVFHQAASKMSVCGDDPERDLRTNALGTLRLVRASAEAGVRKFVHASTGSVLNGTPRSFYGASKWAGESYVRLASEQMDWTVLRYFHVIGPRQDDSDTGGVVPIFIRQARSGGPITVHGDGAQVRSFTSVADVVAANLLVTTDPRAFQQTYVCASGIRVSIADLAEYVTRVVGVVPWTWTARKPGDVDEFAIDNSALRGLGLTFDTDWRAVVRGVIDARQRVAA